MGVKGSVYYYLDCDVCGRRTPSDEDEVSAFSTVIGAMEWAKDEGWEERWSKPAADGALSANTWVCAEHLQEEDE
jgi:hypothetical protein